MYLENATAVFCFFALAINVVIIVSLYMQSSKINRQLHQPIDHRIRASTLVIDCEATYLREHSPYLTGRAERPICFSQYPAQLRDSPFAVGRKSVYQQRDSARTSRLIHYFLVTDTILVSIRACTQLYRCLDAIFAHPGFPRDSDGVRQPRVGLRIRTTAQAHRNGDLTRGFHEPYRLLLVLCALPMQHILPFRVTCKISQRPFNPARVQIMQCLQHFPRNHASARRRSWSPPDS
mmetsp:Transcript_14394/g.38540  ORF Transcript_14394/g.38540 Transcript_14394/m.38540 type:complete len:235 (-) Transcript_14394:304-1008(-)